MFEPNEAVKGLLENDYYFISEKYCRHMAERIISHDKMIFADDPSSSGILTHMKMEAQFLEICSSFNRAMADKNPKLINMPTYTCELHYQKNWANYHESRAEADLRRRFRVMAQEMNDEKGHIKTLEIFGKLGTVEIFLTYRFTGRFYNFGCNHAEYFISEEERKADFENQRLDALSETRLIELFKA